MQYSSETDDDKDNYEQDEDDEEEEEEKKNLLAQQDDNNTLRLDDWVYYIGVRGGLYHSRPNSQEPPKRIHFSHPPIAHQEAVKEFQNQYLKKHNLYLAKRWQPVQKKEAQKKQHMAVKTSTRTNNIHKKDNVEKQQEKYCLDKSETEQQEEQEELSQTLSQLISLRRKPTKKNTQAQHQRSVSSSHEDKKMNHESIFLPKTKKDVEKNLVVLNDTLEKIFQNLKSKLLENFLCHFSILTAITCVFSSPELNEKQLQKLLSERCLNSVQKHNQTKSVSKRQSNFLSLQEPSSLMITIFTRNILFFNDIASLVNIVCFVEPESQENNIWKSDIKDYSQVISKIYTCAKNHHCEIVIVDFDTIQNPKLFFKAWHLLVKSFEKIPESLQLQMEIIITSKKRSLLESDVIIIKDDICKIHANLQDVYHKYENILPTLLFITSSAPDVVVTSESELYLNSTLALTQYVYTNPNLLNNACYQN